MRICAEGDPRDGTFQVTVVGKVGKLTLLRIFPRVFNGSHLGHRAVTAYQAAQVVLSGPDTADGAGPAAATPVSVWADGEYVGLFPATATTVPGALTAFVPDPAEG